MASVLKTAQAGTLESSDIMVTVTPGTGVVIDLESIVLVQYGEDIRRVLAKTAAEQGITDVYIKAVDRGALDCTIRARLMTALGRAGAVLKGAVI
jgi:citrate lyase subunit gamma (acyl carrier protein)